MLGLLALNPLNSTDIIFFIVLAAIVVVCVAVYFLIPVFNKKQYKEQRDNLKKREVAFKSNIQRVSGTNAASDPSESSNEEAGAVMDEVPEDPSKNEEK